MSEIPTAPVEAPAAAAEEKAAEAPVEAPAEAPPAETAPAETKPEEPAPEELPPEELKPKDIDNLWVRVSAISAHWRPQAVRMDFIYTTNVWGESRIFLQPCTEGRSVLQFC